MIVVGMNVFFILDDGWINQYVFGLVILINKEDYYVIGGYKSVNCYIIEGFVLGSVYIL